LTCHPTATKEAQLKQHWSFHSKGTIPVVHDDIVILGEEEKHETCKN